jgi:RNA polymerase sigma factor (sigma-70 family)
MGSAHLGAAMRQIHLLFGEGTLAGLPDAQLVERYLSQRDELAFTALVQRHGPMVLAVCRGVLDDSNDADDAFQAAFLLLARKAKSLWIRDSLGGWLHRVASRIAFQMKSDRARRRDLERRTAEMANARWASGRMEDDTHHVLHQEIDRLPDRYRKPIVLCYLEHMTYQQAANHLRWSEGMTQGRLTRGRNLLRARLSRRGVTLGAATLAALTQARQASAVSVALFVAAVRTARYSGLCEAAGAGTVSTAAEALTNQALRTMMMVQLKIVAAAGIFIGALTGVATGLSASGPISAREPAPVAQRTAPASPEPKSSPGRNTAAVEDMLVYRAEIAGPPEPPEPEAPPEPQVAPPGPRGGNSTHVIEELEAPPEPQAPPPPMVDEEPPANAVNISRDLKAGAQLNRGDSLFSPLCGFRLHMRSDGNLVLYAIDDTRMPDDVQSVLNHSPEALRSYHNSIWSTGTSIPQVGVGSGSYCEMKTDGNFVIYDDDLRPCFYTGTAGNPGAFLRLQDDGNLVLYSAELKVLWTTHTEARAPQLEAGPAAE